MMKRSLLSGLLCLGVLFACQQNKWTPDALSMEGDRIDARLHQVELARFIEELSLLLDRPIHGLSSEQGKLLLTLDLQDSPWRTTLKDLLRQQELTFIEGTDHLVILSMEEYAHLPITTVTYTMEHPQLEKAVTHFKTMIADRWVEHIVTDEDAGTVTVTAHKDIPPDIARTAHWGNHLDSFDRFGPFAWPETLPENLSGMEESMGNASVVTISPECVAPSALAEWVNHHLNEKSDCKATPDESTNCLILQGPADCLQRMAAACRYLDDQRWMVN